MYHEELRKIDRETEFYEAECARLEKEIEAANKPRGPQNAAEAIFGFNPAGVMMNPHEAYMTFPTAENMSAMKFSRDREVADRKAYQVRPFGPRKERTRVPREWIERWGKRWWEDENDSMAHIV